MPEFEKRVDTVPMDLSDKMALFRDRHPVVRELRRIPRILFPGEEGNFGQDCLSLKELFHKNKMDQYHVDCLILRKIALSFLEIARELDARGIYPGLLDLEDVLVDFADSSLSVYLIHPERFQLLHLEQDYEWYPEDERIFGEVTRFDQESQGMAYQRFLYKILVASVKGNVKVPPRASVQDYSAVFYGTLPACWKECFEQGNQLSLSQWEAELLEAISLEESYEKRLQEEALSKEGQMEASQGEEERKSREGECLFVLLRSNPTEAMEISRMLYELQDRLELEAEHTGLCYQQAFVYGDSAVHFRDFAFYDKGFRLQIPQRIREYSMAEALLLACEWMKEREAVTDRRIYLLTDGKIANDATFKACSKSIDILLSQGVHMELLTGRDSSCEGWDSLQKRIQEKIL